MLIISKEKMNALSKHRKENAAQELALIVQAEFQKDRPDWNIEDFLALAENAIERGLEYGLATDNQLYRFTKIMFVYGYDFDTAIPAAAEILNVPGFESWVKLNKLEAWAYPDTNWSNE